MSNFISPLKQDYLELRHESLQRLKKHTGAGVTGRLILKSPLQTIKHGVELLRLNDRPRHDIDSPPVELRDEV